MNLILLLLGFYLILSLTLMSYMMVGSIHKYFEKVQEIIILSEEESYHDDLDGIGASPIPLSISILFGLVIADLCIYNSSYFIDNDFYTKNIYIYLRAGVQLVLIMGCIYAVWKKLTVKYSFYKIYLFNGRYSAVKYGGNWLGAFFGIYWLFFKRLWIPALILSCIYFLPPYLIETKILSKEILNVPTFQVITPVFFLIHLGVGHFGNLLIENNYLNKGYNLTGTIKSHSEKNAVKDFLFTNNITRSQEEIGLFQKLQIQQSLISIGITTFLGIATYLITHHLFGFGIPEASISSILISSILGFFGYKA